MKFCMLHSRDYSPATITVPKVERYCSLHGHSIVRKVCPTTLEGWERIPFLQEMLASVDDGTWLVWCEANVLFLREDFDLSGNLSEDKSFVFADSGTSPWLNAGFFALKVEPISRELLSRCLMTKGIGPVGFGSHKTVQEAFRGVIETDPLMRVRTTRFPSSVIQGPNTEYSKTAFAAHLSTPGTSAQVLERVKLVLEKGWGSVGLSLTRS